MKKLFSAIAAFALAASSLCAQQMQQLPNDPEVVKGKLDNGMTYYIRHNAKPEGRAEFYLATNVGAIQETPDQDGLAHFLEHMCFNGTKNFPGKAILEWLQSIGASFGGNVNASTGIEETQYMLNNIPLARESVIDSCLLIMHDYSHFVTNDSEEIDKERGVIIEERRARRNAAWRTFEKSLPYYYGTSKYATCTLIGSQENLETFKPESLHEFYRTWYRPDLQALIVVGDVDVKSVEEKIKTIFADIPAAENPKAKDVIAVEAHEEPWVGVLTDPETTVPSVEVLWESDATPEEFNSTPQGLMMDLIKSVISSVMSERFDDITSRADAPFLYGSFSIGNICEATEAVTGSVSLKSDSILGGFKDFYTEIERLKRYGMSEAEVGRAKTNILAGYEKAANEASTRKNSEFVWPLIRNFFDNQPYMVPQTRYEYAKGILENLNADIFNQMIPMMMTGENLSVIYSGPEKEGIDTPSAEQLLAVMAEVENSEIEAPAEESLDAELLDPASLKGSEVKKTGTAVYGSTEWTLKNGVKVVVLPTDYKKDQVLFNLYKSGGLSLIPTEDIASFDDNIYGTFQYNQGVASFKGTDLSKMLAGKVVSVSPFLDSYYHGISGNSSVKDLETAMQLVYLNYVQPRFDQEEYDNAVNQLKSILPNLMSRPDFVFQKRYTGVLYGDNPRNEFISMEKIDKADLQTIEKYYTELFADAAGATMVFVGDVDLETLKPLVEKYIGSIPKGKNATQWKDVQPKIAKGKVEDSFAQDMETPITTVLQFYTMYKPYSVKDEVLASAVDYILRMVYTDTMREDEGGTYGASVASAARRIPEGTYILQVYYNSKPALGARLKELALEGVRNLAEEGPTDEQFTRTIENFKKTIPEKEINNSYWLQNIVSNLRYGGDAAEEWRQAVDGLTKEDIQSMARQFLESGNFIEVEMTPGNTTEAE